MVHPGFQQKGGSRLLQHSEENGPINVNPTLIRAAIVAALAVLVPGGHGREARSVTASLQAESDNNRPAPTQPFGARDDGRMWCCVPRCGRWTGPMTRPNLKAGVRLTMPTCAFTTDARQPNPLGKHSMPATRACGAMNYLQPRLWPPIPTRATPALPRSTRQRPIDFMQRHNHPGLLRCNKGKCTQNKAKRVSLPDPSRTEREKIQPQVVERQRDSPGSIQPPRGKYTNMFGSRMPPGARLHQG